MNTTANTSAFVLTVLPAFLSPWLTIIIKLLCIVLIVLSIRLLWRILHAPQDK